jgi:hypothetical protein
MMGPDKGSEAFDFIKDFSSSDYDTFEEDDLYQQKKQAQVNVRHHITAGGPAPRDNAQYARD